MQDDIIPPNRNKKLGKSALSHKITYRGEAIEQIQPKTTVDDEPIALDEAGKEIVPSAKIENKKSRFAWWYKLGQKQKVAIIGAVLLILSALSIGVFYLTRPDPAVEISIAQAPAVLKPTTVASPLTGVQVEPELAKRPVTGVMIENSPDARPQSGLQKAGVVYEAIAEGGITRFLALYQEDQPNYVGPVRSLRPYYIDWAKPFDSSIAHVGGSPEALATIRHGGKDLDQFFNAGSYWRVSSRAAPHNVYTSFTKLDALNKSKGYKTSKFTGWLRKDEPKVINPTIKRIDLNISSTLFNVNYIYSAKDNTYSRSEGGQKHLYTTKESDGHPKQLRPKVVIALVVSYGIASDGHHSKYQTVGKGIVYIFQDGGVTKGTWIKKSPSRQIKFIDSKGKPIALNAGQTWVTAVGASSMVHYKVEKVESAPTQ